MRTPHVWLPPALTEANSPAGDMAWPYSTLPQQATEPLVLTPHVWLIPALTEANSPADCVSVGEGVGAGLATDGSEVQPNARAAVVARVASKTALRLRSLGMSDFTADPPTHTGQEGALL